MRTGISITSAKLGRSQPRDAAIQQAAQGVPILFDNFDEFQLSLFHLLKSFIRAAVLKFHDPVDFDGKKDVFRCLGALNMEKDVLKNWEHG